LTKQKKMLYDIVKYPDPILSRKDLEAVEDFDSSWLTTMAIDMIYTMRHVGGVGLAAPQIGIGIPMVVALIDRAPVVLINPKLTGHPDERKVSIPEQCLSCPNESVRIPRYEWIRVDYDDLKGRRKWIELSGINAIIVQHEIDHILGKTIMDYKDASGS